MRGPSELGVRTMGRVEEVAEFNDIIMKNVSGAPVRIRDIGYVEDGMAERRNFAYLQRQARRHTRCSPADRHEHGQVVEGDPEAAAERSTSSFRRASKIDVIKEQATYIKNSVEALEEHLVLGSLLASFIVWLFIRDWRTVLISSIAIPTSIITTFTLMRMMDFTLNSMTLLGLTLAVGIVIDDAIIVLENIYRYHRGEGHAADGGGGPRDHAKSRWRCWRPRSRWSSSSCPIAFMTGYAQALPEPVRLDDGVFDPGLDAGSVHADADA